MQAQSQQNAKVLLVFTFGIAFASNSKRHQNRRHLQNAVLEGVSYAELVSNQILPARQTWNGDVLNSVFFCRLLFKIAELYSR